MAGHRARCHFSAFLISIPLLLFAVLLAGIYFTSFVEPPKLAALKRDYSEVRADMETLLRMSGEDSNYWRIAPTWFTHNQENRQGPQIPLPQARWDLYRKLFPQNGIKLGIKRYRSGDVFIMADGAGNWEGGHSTGYLHCASTAEEIDEQRPSACVLNQAQGERKYVRGSNAWGYRFERLAEHWYVYDEIRW